MQKIPIIIVLVALALFCVSCVGMGHKEDEFDFEKWSKKMTQLCEKAAGDKYRMECVFHEYSGYNGWKTEKGTKGLAVDVFSKSDNRVIFSYFLYPSKWTVEFVGIPTISSILFPPKYLARSSECKLFCLLDKDDKGIVEKRQFVDKLIELLGAEKRVTKEKQYWDEDYGDRPINNPKSQWKPKQKEKSFNWDEWRDSVIVAAKNSSIGDMRFESYRVIMPPYGPKSWTTPSSVKGLDIYFSKSKGKNDLGGVCVFPTEWIAHRERDKIIDATWKKPVYFARSSTCKMLAYEFDIDNDYVKNLMKALGAEMRPASMYNIDEDDPNPPKTLCPKELEDIPEVPEDEK